MGPEQKRLMDRLFNDPQGRTLRNFHFTVGDGNPTPEQVCGEINKAMDELDRRKALGIPSGGPPHSKKEPRSVRDIIAELDR